MNELIGLIIITVGVLFDFFGVLGLLRLPDVYNRLQAATKCITLGTCGIMLGTFVMNGFTGLGIKALIAIPFIFFTAATGSHALARGAHKFGIKLWHKSVCDKYREKVTTDKGNK